MVKMFELLKWQGYERASLVMQKANYAVKMYMELSYEGAKEMLLVDDVENRDFLRELLESMYEELPAPKKKKK